MEVINQVFFFFFLNKWSVYKQIPHTEGLKNLLVNVDKNDVHEQITP